MSYSEFLEHVEPNEFDSLNHSVKTGKVAHTVKSEKNMSYEKWYKQFSMLFDL